MKRILPTVFGIAALALAGSAFALLGLIGFSGILLQRYQRKIGARNNGAPPTLFGLRIKRRARLSPLFCVLR